MPHESIVTNMQFRTVCNSFTAPYLRPVSLFTAVNECCRHVAGHLSELAAEVRRIRTAADTVKGVAVDLGRACFAITGAGSDAAQVYAIKDCIALHLVTYVAGHLTPT